MMNEYVYGNEELTININVAKSHILERLLIDGIISKEQAEEYNEKWNIIIFKPSLFKAWKEKFFNKKNKLEMRFVKFED